MTSTGEKEVRKIIYVIDPCGQYHWPEGQNGAVEVYKVDSRVFEKLERYEDTLEFYEEEIKDLPKETIYPDLLIVI